MAEGAGTANITNSEIAYLGYESGVCGGRTGLTYHGGDNSVLKGNKIHDLYFAFYSRGVGGMKIEDNHIYDNGHYGLDPPTGTHDMLIRNNTVHDNGSIGVICSLECSKIKIEDNTVYNNSRMGMMLSRNNFDSVVKGNTISQPGGKALVISESQNNEIYNNSITNSETGIDLDKESEGNSIHNNIVKLGISNKSTQPTSPSSLQDAIAVEEGAGENNKLFSNIVVDTDGRPVDYNGGSQPIGKGEAKETGGTKD